MEPNAVHIFFLSLDYHSSFDDYQLHILIYLILGFGAAHQFETSSL